MKKIILGIETSCDDTSIGVLSSENDKIEVLSHRTFGQEEILKTWGGVVPEIAARNHLQKLAPLLESTTNEAGITIDDIDLIGVTCVPGLLGPLLTGLNAAKTVAMLARKPIMPVNHLYAHLEAIHLTKKMAYPYLGLLISGGHTIFFLVQSSTDFRVLGSTIDDAAGEAFDKGGKLLGLGYPAGRIIDELAKEGDPLKYEFPIGLKSSADCRFSFSGLKTALRVFLERNPELADLGERRDTLSPEERKALCDVCASYQHAIVTAINLKARYALQLAYEITGIKNLPIVVGGGVACNSGIRAGLAKKYSNVNFVDPKYCADNGAMIANYALINEASAIAYPECLQLDARGRFINKKDFSGKTSKSK
ncbi:MAG: tRNA (adenosine(37)-N6)-threonylcarbamoyltransferase complex transferase subunit TsaD [Bacteriovoracaceae bacterium]|nr:tRNA (adenosine(37)-N6)-threonylcarbamoyltransferase complex transferase subunit TsaD [Bacteriovoracaceae bacterium]